MNKKIETRDSSIYNISEKDVKEFILEKFENAKKSNKIKELVTFQNTNKFLIMSYDQKELKKLRHIVAKYKKGQLSGTILEYGKHLKISLEKESTIKTHCNVIMHIFEYFSKNFNQYEKEVFLIH